VSLTLLDPHWLNESDLFAALCRLGPRLRSLAWAWRSPDPTEVTRLLRHCPRLQTLSCGGEVLASLRTLPHPLASLRRLDIHRAPLSAADVRTVLTRLPHLRRFTHTGHILLPDVAATLAASPVRTSVTQACLVTPTTLGLVLDRFTRLEALCVLHIAHPGCLAFSAFTLLPLRTLALKCVALRDTDLHHITHACRELRVFTITGEVYPPTDVSSAAYLTVTEVLHGLCAFKATILNFQAPYMLLQFVWEKYFLVSLSC